MARIRTVKPEFWTDEVIGEASPSARLLFIGTWNFADDHGGLERSAKQLKAQVFPYDQIDCEPLVEELLDLGLLIEYEAAGKRYLHIKGFRKHQKVENPARARIPLYEDSAKIARTPRGVTEDSGKSQTSNGLFSSSLEGKGGDTAQEDSPRKTSRGTRLPSDFVLTDARRAYAAKHHVNAELAFEKFTNHWRAKSGKDATKVDWDATWQNWCLEDERRQPPRREEAPSKSIFD